MKLNLQSTSEKELLVKLKVRCHRCCLHLHTVFLYATLKSSKKSKVWVITFFCFVAEEFFVISEVSETEAKEFEPKTPLDFSKFFLSEDLSDVSVVCGSDTFPAHRIVLKGT